ncbi:MAG TPA: hypothetical protein VFN13_11960 [Rudaea sp.]|nr:hypothetical protein [Rudaea sp.]
MTRQRWCRVWLPALLIVAVIVVGAELHWRALGYHPNIRDSSQLWSIQRDRVYATTKTPLVLLGASRIEFGVDTGLLARLLPKYLPVMLAQNAHYPLAVLRDLANDTDFHGVVICDIESNGLTLAYRGMQQPLVDYYHTQWSPSWHLHRLLLTLWQKHAVVADPQLGVAATLLRLIDGHAPPRQDYFRFYADRSGDIDYSQTDVAAARRHFDDMVAKGTVPHALVSADVWLEDLAPVFAWTRRIRARGGEVIFYRSPTSGVLPKAEAIMYPPEQYWNRFVAMSPAPVVDAAAITQLSAFKQPDDSHLDFRDKPAYTRALVDVLVTRGLVKR